MSCSPPSISTVPHLRSQPRIVKIVHDPWLVESTDAEPVDLEADSIFIEKDPYISGPVFKPVLFKGQL